MRNHTTTGKLELTWTKVEDTRGRIRMEACWRAVPASAPAAATHAA